MYELCQNEEMIVWLLLGVDLLLKYFAVHLSVQSGGDYAVINTGATFGVFMGSEWILWVMISIIFIWLYQHKLWLILAGGVANAVSRIVWGGVVDYWIFFGWFHNNLADWMIVGGIMLYVFDHIKPHRIFQKNL